MTEQTKISQFKVSNLPSKTISSASSITHKHYMDGKISSSKSTQTFISAKLRNKKNLPVAINLWNHPQIFLPMTLSPFLSTLFPPLLIQTQTLFQWMSTVFKLLWHLEENLHKLNVNTVSKTTCVSTAENQAMSWLTIHENSPVMTKILDPRFCCRIPPFICATPSFMLHSLFLHLAKAIVL